jgi:hypothetical protein
MAAGGFKEFVAGEVLDEDDINDFLMQGVLVFAGTAARGSAITSPVEGQFSFRTDDDVVEFWDGSAWVELSTGGVEFSYLVVGGGAGGGGSNTDGGGNGGGGAGGYRCNVSGENTGGGITAEPIFALNPGSYTVTVGAGGAGGAQTNYNLGVDGSPSRFASIFAYGGGGGGAGGKTPTKGGSGGGAAFGNPTIIAAGLAAQGFASGTANPNAPGYSGGGGGGASAVGVNAPSATAGGAGGAGVASSITGSSVTRGGGGGGGSSSTGGAGGTGGGGAGGASTVGTAGTVNTGGGGGGGGLRAGGNGGSGIVVLKYPDTITLTIGGGLTSSTSTAGGFKTTTFTAGTDTVTIP